MVDVGQTIEEVATAVGMTVRNVRAHQSRGLLPPPEVRGRTGYYGAEHLARLQLIRQMQEEGFNLRAIRKILERMPLGSAGQVLGLERALRTPFGDEQAVIVSEAEVLTALQARDTNAGAVKRALKLGLIRSLGEDRYELPSPALARAGAELSRHGVSAEQQLDLEERLIKHCDRLAREFADAYLEYVWKPFDQAGRPDSEWPRIQEALERLRPLAREALLATFAQSIARGMESVIEKVVQRPARPR